MHVVSVDKCFISQLVLSTDNTLPEERLPVIREALPIFTRPSENFELWKNAVMRYRSQLESSFESNEVYGVLWEMSFTRYGNKSYIPQVSISACMWGSHILNQTFTHRAHH